MVMRKPSPEQPPDEAGPSRGGPARTSAAPDSVGVAYLAELEPELRGAAIFDSDGGLLECSVPAASGFVEAASTLVGRLDDFAAEPIDHCHIASDEAEVFLVREAGLTLVAVAARFVLASLMTYDIRMTLRDLARGGSGA